VSLEDIQHPVTSPLILQLHRSTLEVFNSAIAFWYSPEDILSVIDVLFYYCIYFCHPADHDSKHK